MGSLFLSGTIKQMNFKKKIHCDYQKGLIIIPVKINNSAKSYRFIFDTGAAFNVISEKIAAEFRFKKVVIDTISDANKKKQKIPFVKVDNIEIGGLHFKNTAAAVLNLNKTVELKCYGCDGVIGLNLIRLTPFWQIDYRNRQIIMTDKKAIINKNNYKYKIPFKKNIQRIPIIEVILKNMKMKFSVDSGSTGGFTGNYSQWEKLLTGQKGISFIKCSGEVSGGALGNKKGISILCKIGSFSTGNLQMKKIILTFSPNSDPRVGNDFFKDYVLTLDWPNHQLLLNPSPGIEVKDRFFSFGFRFSYDKTKKLLYISSIFENSPASIAGMKIGDKIVKINDQSLSDLELDQYCQYYFNPDQLFGEKKKCDIQVERNHKQLNFSMKKKNLFQ